MLIQTAPRDQLNRLQPLSPPEARARLAAGQGTFDFIAENLTGQLFALPVS